MLKRLRALQWDNLAKLAVIHFFTSLYFYAPAGTLYLRSRGLNYVQTNSMWGIIVTTMFLTEVPAGLLADRLGRKYTVSVAMALQTLGEVIYIFADNYYLFALAAVVGGLGFAFGSGSIEALVSDTLRTQRREGEMTKAMGAISAAQRLGNLLAYAAGGFLVGQLTQARFVLAITITACAVAIGWLITFTLREPQVEAEHAGDENALALLKDGIRLFRAKPRFLRLVLLSLATIAFKNYLSGLYQPYFVQAGVRPVWLGLALSLAAGLSVVGARYAYWLEERLGTQMSLLLVTGGPGLLYLMMGVVLHPLFSVLIFCSLYSSMSLKAPIFSGHLNRHIASKNRATVLSLISMASGLYEALMGLLIGYIADISLRAGFIAMGIIVLVGTLLFRGNQGLRTES